MSCVSGEDETVFMLGWNRRTVEERLGFDFMLLCYFHVNIYRENIDNR